jgi:hypothetical protein
MSFMGIVIAVLAVVGLWHLFSTGGKRAASVWFFLSQVALVLGALLLIGLLFGGVSTRLSYEHRHAAQSRKNVAEAKARLEAVAARIHKKSGTDTPVPIDKLWERLNRSRIPDSPVMAERVTAAAEVAVETEDENGGKGVGEAAAPVATETAEDMAASAEKGGRIEPVDDRHEETAAASPAVEDPAVEDPAGKAEPGPSATGADAYPAASGERPNWVVHPPKRVGNTYRRVVASGPYRTVDECHQALQEKLRQAVCQRLAAAATDDPAYLDFIPASCEDLGIGIDYIYREICRDEYVESLEASFGPMVQVHLLLEFDPPIEKHLGDVWKQYQVRQRLGIVAFLAAAGLLLLGLVYGLLKLDTWTRGYYSKRLLLGVPAVIISLVMLLLVWKA